MTRRPTTPDPRDARDQAIAWLVRVESDAATEADWRGLEAWLSAAAENRAAFDEVEVMSAAFADARDEIAAGLLPDEPRPRVVDLTARRAPSRRIWLAAAGSAMAASVVGAVGFGLLSQPVTRIYETARGEIRSVRLDDGTHIDLNGASRVRVRFERGARRVFLEDAEAAFDVAHDARRPFIIEAGDRSIRVVGTQFNVRNDSRQLTVTVRRGVVEVRPLAGGGGSARLTAGRQLNHRIGSDGSAIGDVTPEEAFAWTSGRLVCRDRRLEDIVADLNRGLPTPMSVDPGVADLRFSGVLMIDDQETVLRSLQAYLPIRAAREAGTIRLVSR